jgi:multicomponent Na+:H+ antiporter subunit D
MALYLFFELVTLFSFPLVLHNQDKEAIAAAFKYLYYSIAGTSLAAVGFFFIYTYGVTLEFTAGGVLDAHKLIGHERKLLIVTLLTIIGFGAKAGMFPMHAWLPDAHSIAPAPASAILSGVITKAGVFAVFRFVYNLIGTDILRGTWLQFTWISLALFTGLMGSLLAFRETAIKRRLAYSTISQMGYILFGLSLLTASGLLGAMLQIVFHSIVKNALFLIAGLIIINTKKSNVDDLHGIGKQMPAMMCCFALSSLSLIGIPPTGGFTGKWYLATSALISETGFFSWLGCAALLFSALLAAAYLLPIGINAFFTSNKEHECNSYKISLSMTIPIIFLTIAALLLGFFPRALISLFERIAGGFI